MWRERAAGLAAGATARVPDTERSQDRRLGREESWFCGPVSTQPRAHGVRPHSRRWRCSVSMPGCPSRPGKRDHGWGSSVSEPGLLWADTGAGKQVAVALGESRKGHVQLPRAGSHPQCWEGSLQSSAWAAALPPDRTLLCHFHQEVGGWSVLGLPCQMCHALRAQQRPAERRG